MRCTGLLAEFSSNGYGLMPGILIASLCLFCVRCNSVEPSNKIGGTEYICLNSCDRFLQLKVICYCNFIPTSCDRGSDCCPSFLVGMMLIERSPTQPLQKEASCRGRAISPTKELAIFVIFFFIDPIHTHFFSIPLSLQQAHERI